ncbi:hypothetical protein FQA39_LY16639 [Lamprigera yunnana]|nr:hypothetical protein FQA39_LY16639 [Lamprigera yunnana]
MNSESDADEDAQEVPLLRGGNMESEADHRVHKRFSILYGIASGLGALLIVLMFIWIVSYQGGFGIDDADKEFYWHPMLMVLGLIFLYAQAMLVYRVARNAKKKILKLTHAALHCFAFILTVIALKAAFDSHNFSVPSKPNLYTLHSWIGLITVILFTYQFLSGFLTFLFPGFSKEVRATYLPIHTHFGAAIFTMVIITAMMGIAEKAIWSVDKYSNTTNEAILVNFMGVILVGFGALVVYLVNDPSYKRVALAEDEIILPDRID